MITYCVLKILYHSILLIPKIALALVQFLFTILTQFLNAVAITIEGKLGEDDRIEQKVVDSIVVDDVVQEIEEDFDNGYEILERCEDKWVRIDYEPEYMLGYYKLKMYRNQHPQKVMMMRKIG